MSDRHIISNTHRIAGAHMHHGIVLYIRPAANGNLIGIATNRCIVPDARVFSNCDISFDNCTLCHIVSHGLSS